MCTTCGCDAGDAASVEGKPLGHAAGSALGDAAAAGFHASPIYRSAPATAGVHGHRHADGTWHEHSHDPLVTHDHTHEAIVPHHRADELARTLQVERDILATNDAIAASNRRWFDEHGVFAVNLVSSPGSGKTSLLVATAKALAAHQSIAVIEGDQRTSLDAERVRATGVPAVQINTAKGCHLDARMVSEALQQLRLRDDSLLLIENVGNLVCPAAFDLGEAHKVVILSVTEGEDKPLKYPDMFHAADLMIVNKIDLLPHVDFDVQAAIGYARRVRPGIEALLVSARTGEGLGAWLAWLRRGVAKTQARRTDTIETLRRRVAELEARLAPSTSDAGAP
ncbi:MAG TPA: hydrogenase nickel incorporation protein HypB [Casimicrobiaceae bacterium]|nr:hydrogenase nickel incorporation protein HypB [Casimicrobiaceae bacterium]